MIRVDNIYKSFDGVSVLQGASLEVRDGETFAIIGRSGSGKSVLMKHMIGLLQPDMGTISIDGTDINKISYRELQEIRKQFGVLFQGGALFDSMDAFDNVAFPLRTFSSLKESDIRAQVDQCLAMVDLPTVGSKFPPELSGGMRKRVALARAIAMSPRYIMYDEPTSGLDPETSNTIDDLIKSLSTRLQVTSVVVTHDMHSVLNIADRAALVHKGVIHWTGTVAEIHKCEDSILTDFVKANEYQIGGVQAEHAGAAHRPE